MSEGTLYERVVERGGFEPPPVKLRASSSVVLWRRRGDGEVEVFWIRRDPAMRFMGGWHAFPGGTVSRHDEALEDAAWIVGRPRGLDRDRWSGAMPEALVDGLGPLAPDAVSGIVAATLRELFEETGLLPIASGGATATFAPDRVAEARRAVEARETAFGELLGEAGLRLDAARLVFAARWMTPAFAPMRFDNRFFLLEHRPEDGEPVAGTEAVEAEWVRPADAVRAWLEGRVTAAPPIVHILKTLATAGDGGPEAALERLREPIEANLGPHRSIELRPGVLLFPLPTPTLPPAAHTNCYVLGTGDAVLVDPGSPWPEEIDRMEAAVRALPDRLGRRVSAIWLTHHHPDHIGGVAELHQRLGIPVAAHPLTAERLRARGIAVERTIADDEQIELAGPEGSEGADPMPVRALHTPGHAAGHLCFLEGRLGSLLAGDMVSALSTIVIDPPEGDMDAYLASLERLAALEPRMLFAGHGPPIPDAVAKLRELIDHRLWREEKVVAAWRSGLRAAEAMLPEVYDDAPRQAWPLAQRQIEAHLVRLRRAGTIGE